MASLKLRLLGRGAVAAPTPVNTSLPVISGTANVGLTLSVSTGSWTNSPDSYTYQWLNGGSPISGATNSTYTLASTDEGDMISAQVVAHKGLAASIPATSTAVGPVGAAPAKLTPSASYNGTPGSGWPGGVGEPVVTTRGSIPQPTVTPLFEDWKTIDGDTILAWNGGGYSFEKFVIYWEGGSAEVTERTLETLYDSEGNPYESFAYHSPPLNHAVALSQQGGVKGESRLYIKAIPADTVNFEPRVVMMTIYPSPVMWDVIKTIHRTPGSGDYTTVQDFYAAARADLGNRWKGVITDTGKSWAIGQVSTTNNTKYWTTLTTAPGVTATLGDGTLSTTQLRLDQQHYMGSGLKLDRGQLGYNGDGACLTGRTGALDRFWFDCCEITCSNFNSAAGNAAGFVGHGEGWQALCNGRQPAAWLAPANSTNPNFFFTEVYFHDIPGDGIFNYRLARNVVSDKVSGSTYQGCRGATWNSSTAHLGGIDPGLRNYQPAIFIQYNYGAGGAAAWAGIEKIPTNGNESFPLTITNAGSGYTNGTYNNTDLTTLTGTGTGARADIVVSGGVITSCVADMFGSGFKTGDTLTATLPGGAGFVATVGGNFNFYEGASQGTATITQRVLIQDITTLEDITAQINAFGSGRWSATWTNTNFMSGTFLAVNNGVNVVASNIPLEHVPPGGLQTDTVMDIHASASGHSAGGTNVTFWGFDANYNSAASFQAGGGTRRDFLVENCSWIDNNGGGESGYWKNNTDQHVVLRYCTFIDTGIVFGQPGPGADPPYYTPLGWNVIDHVAINGLGAYPADPLLERSAIVSLSQTQTSVNSLGWTNSLGWATGAPAVPTYANNQVYVDPLSDLTPLELTPGFYPLELPDGTIAGRKGIDGLDQIRSGGIAP